MRKPYRTLEEKISPLHTALLIIDVQNDMCHPEGAFAQMGFDVSPLAATVPNIAELAQAARNAGILTIYTVVSDQDLTAISDAYYEVNLTFYERAMAKKKPSAAPAPQHGSDWGTRLFPPLAPHADDVVLLKHRFGAFTNTKLDQILRSNQIKTVVLAGMLTDVCLESTARCAIDMDYYVVVAADCTATLSEERQQCSLRIMGNIIGTIADLDELQRIWNSQPGLSASDE